jgi:hypothetical protein
LLFAKRRLHNETVSKSRISWTKDPEDDDYAAAASYLSLLMSPEAAGALVKRLRRSQRTKFPAKDILRASRLPLLGLGDWHVEKDRARIRKRKELSPLLLVRGRAGSDLVIADGYHRLCAVYSFDEDAVIHCKIV